MVNRIDNRIYKYQDIVNVFGQSYVGDDDKTLAQWDIDTPYGWAEIYDYKSYATRLEDIEEWHVQAANDEAFNWVYDRLSQSIAQFAGSQDY